MKKVFLNSEAYNMVGFVFGSEMIAFDCETLEEAKNMELESIEGCQSAEEAAMNCNTEVFPFIESEWEAVTAF